jgi:DNA-binding MurR/RpiR family transcriptional regulator
VEPTSTRDDLQHDGRHAGDREHSAPDQLADLFTGVRLTPVQRRLALHIVEQGSKVAFTSSVELAEQVGVSQPSVTRLAAALGFSGFADFQRVVQEFVLAREEQSTPADLNKMQRAVQHSIDNLTALQESLADMRPFSEAARVLAEAQTLVVYGPRASAPLARHFAYFASRIRPHVRLAEGSASEINDLLEDAVLSGPAALLAAILPRYPRESVAVLETAHALGLAMVLITDSALSPLAELATITLPAQVNHDLVYDAPVAPAQVLVILLEALADTNPSRSRMRLDRFENTAAAAHHFLGE